MNYEALLNDADAEGLNIKERPFRTYDGRIKGKDIANIFIITDEGITNDAKSIIERINGGLYTFKDTSYIINKTYKTAKAIEIFLFSHSKIAKIVISTLL